MNFDEFPLAPGTYVLLVRVDQPLTLAVGRLGTVTFSGGYYAYVGSAHGPGGLRARLRRHLRAAKPLHWHIDYLTAAAPVTAIWLRESPERLECVWARELIARGSVPVPRFGSSDCSCPAHLVTLTEEAIPAARAALMPITTISLLGGNAE
jgi:Uri superfamily endonuclease